jgi:nickel transport protein
MTTLLYGSFLLSHGVEVSESYNSAKVIRFSYSDDTPMMYAKVKLYPPSNPTVETIKSLSDKNGFFAFVPDEEGKWKAEATDGMGHKGEIVIDVTKTSSITATYKGDIKQTSLFLRIILGLSLILNIFAIYGLIFKKVRQNIVRQ